MSGWPMWRQRSSPGRIGGRPPPRCRGSARPRRDRCRRGTRGRAWPSRSRSENVVDLAQEPVAAAPGDRDSPNCPPLPTRIWPCCPCPHRQAVADAVGHRVAHDLHDAAGLAGATVRRGVTGGAPAAAGAAAHRRAGARRRDGAGGTSRSWASNQPPSSSPASGVTPTPAGRRVGSSSPSGQARIWPAMSTRVLVVRRRRPTPRIAFQASMRASSFSAKPGGGDALDRAAPSRASGQRGLDRGPATPGGAGPAAAAAGCCGRGARSAARPGARRLDRSSVSSPRSARRKSSSIGSPGLRHGSSRSKPAVGHVAEPAPTAHHVGAAVGHRDHPRSSHRPAPIRVTLDRAVGQADEAAERPGRSPVRRTP